MQNALGHLRRQKCAKCSTRARILQFNIGHTGRCYHLLNWCSPLAGAVDTPASSLLKYLSGENTFLSQNVFRFLKNEVSCVLLNLIALPTLQCRGALSF